MRAVAVNARAPVVTDLLSPDVVGPVDGLWIDRPWSTIRAHACLVVSLAQPRMALFRMGMAAQVRITGQVVRRMTADGVRHMTISTERFVVDEAGDKVAVLIDMAEYLRLLEEIEELESIRAYDAAKADTQAEVIPFEQAVREIEHFRE